MEKPEPPGITARVRAIQDRGCQPKTLVIDEGWEHPDASVPASLDRVYPAPNSWQVSRQTPTRSGATRVRASLTTGVQLIARYRRA